ncbi:MAG TPA: hypothetical protein VK174_07640 [Chitinophagales bacterium]|nr:hypothetical protein [Chitinophagales bacterium]
MIDILEGTWHLLYSNFKMWKGEDVANVTFNYTAIDKSSKPAMLDEVIYQKGKEQKTITGYDYPEDDAKFTWRGKGLMSVLSSNWQVEWINDTKDCIIISFEKTLLTPAGVDILTRTQNPPARIIAEAKQIIETNERLRTAAEGLFAVPQN